MNRDNYDDYRDLQQQHLEDYSILTPYDVMQILGVGKNTVYRLLSSGQLKGIRIGRSWRITEDALNSFLSMAHD